MITTKIGYIQRTYDENNIPHFKFIVAKVKSVRFGAKATKVYTKEFYPLDLEDLESTTEMIDTKGIIIVQEPFMLKDGEEKYFQSVVDKWNKEPPKSIFD